MKTPVYDFVQGYVAHNAARFHMPGHKGQPFLGCEPGDITEIAGADVLSEPEGILEESQKNASGLFGTGATFYATEGSSLCIKAMLATALVHWKGRQGSGGGEARPWILAARNVHRSMVDGCALLDLDVDFIPWRGSVSICSARAEGTAVEEMLCRCKSLPVGVYLTSPDYLGIESDIVHVSKVCRRFGVPLLVDNAHGAYLAFLEESRHPIALGADMCCDSAHKTLPVLTGGAYLHISRACAGRLSPLAARMLPVFGSTSPSYLILQSLDLCNQYLSEGYSQRLKECIRDIEGVKAGLRERGIDVWDTEPLKIVVDTAASGFYGWDIAAEMRGFLSADGVQGMECEYADDQFLVCMLTPENGENDFACLRAWVKDTKLNNKKPALHLPNREPLRQSARRMSIREALLSASQLLPPGQAVGRVLAQETVSCPPAVPIGISGEEVTAEMAEAFQAYGIGEIAVVACNG